MFFLDESKNSFNLFRQILNFTQIRLSALKVSLILGLLGSVSEAISLILIIPCIKLVLRGEPSNQRNLGEHFPQFLVPPYDIVFLASLIVLFACIQHACFYHSKAKAIELSGQLNKRLKDGLFKKLLAFKKLYFDSRNKTQIELVTIGFSNQVSQIILRVNNYALEFVLLVVHLLVMAFVFPTITLVLLLSIPILLTLFNAISHSIFLSANVRKQCDIDLVRRLREALEGITLVKISNSQGREIEHFNSILDQEEVAWISQQKELSLLWPLRDILGLLILLAVFIFIYIYLNPQPSDIALIGIYVILLRRIGSSFAMMGELSGYLASVHANLSGVCEILNDGASEEIQSGEIQSGKKLFKGFQDQIEFRELNFSYPNQRMLFKSLNLKIKKGEKLAIIGQSGAGKSTLINLFMRLYEPISGEILVDGVSLADYTLSSWHASLAAVTQEPILFSGTLRENITYGLNSYSEDDLSKAILMASLGDLLERCNLKLNTLVGDRGLQMSQGERQRISLARAFLSDPEILILDEPLSALDAETENEIQNSIDLLCQDRTVVIIAHRLSSIINSDHVIFLKEGRIVEEGRPHALLEDGNSLFSSYWKIQNV